MTIKGVTMPGALRGLAAFFIPDFSALSDPMIWVDAVGQVFYSMSVMRIVLIINGITLVVNGSMMVFLNQASQLISLLTLLLSVLVF